MNKKINKLDALLNLKKKKKRLGLVRLTPFALIFISPGDQLQQQSLWCNNGGGGGIFLKVK